MPSSGQDGRVRTPLSLREQLEHLHLHEASARCESLCSSPLRPSQSSDDSEYRHEMSSTPRPALNRSAASHHTDKSSKSTYSTGTDGSSCAQSDDSNLPGYLTKFVDANTFEQASCTHHVGVVATVLMSLDPRNGRRRRRARIQPGHRFRLLRPSKRHFPLHGRLSVNPSPSPNPPQKNPLTTLSLLHTAKNATCTTSRKKATSSRAPRRR
jgi:hypothetical protein